MCVVTRYCLTVLLANGSKLPVHSIRNSAVKRMFAPLVAECSQLTQTAVWDDDGCCPLEHGALAVAGRLERRHGYTFKPGQQVGCVAQW